MSDPMSSVFPNRGVLPPCIHGSKSNTRNLRVDSEPETSTQKSCELREDFDEILPFSIRFFRTSTPLMPERSDSHL
nr:hypothetical protein CFP56_73335 [Quercus suber]